MGGTSCLWLDEDLRREPAYRFPLADRSQGRQGGRTGAFPTWLREALEPPISTQGSPRAQVALLASSGERQYLLGGGEVKNNSRNLLAEVISFALTPTSCWSPRAGRERRGRREGWGRDQLINHLMQSHVGLYLYYSLAG